MSVEKSKGKKKPEAESDSELKDGGKITVGTVEEQKYVNMFLDVLRGVRGQWKYSLMSTTISAHQHCNGEEAVDPRCIKALEESGKQQTLEEENYIKRVVCVLRGDNELAKNFLILTINSC